MEEEIATDEFDPEMPTEEIVAIKIQEIMDELQGTLPAEIDDRRQGCCK